MKKDSFLLTVLKIAIPVALQSMLQSSFSMIDQVMVGQLGSVSIAAIGVAGKFAFMYSSIIGAVAAICGIMISQYMGQRDDRRRDVSLCVNLALGLVIALIFLMPSLIMPEYVIRLYSTDAMLISEASGYLRIISGNYPATGIAAILSVRLRCEDEASKPLYAGLASVIANTMLNYMLIFGKAGLPAMGVRGAGIASLISDWIGAVLVCCFFLRMIKNKDGDFHISIKMTPTERREYIKMLMPLVITEFLWSLGQNVYAGIYGHIGTGEMAAIQLISPVEALAIGALAGLSQAAGILIGKRLGADERDEAYLESKKLMLYGFIGSVFLSCLVIALRKPYADIYNVDDMVKGISGGLLICFALLAPFKVINMILGGGIIRSGGKTDYIMWIDTFGTWVLGVPTGLVLAYIIHAPVTAVYFCIGLEEIARVAISLRLFISRKWMVKL